MPLPPVPPAFAWTHEPWGAALVCTPLAEVAPHLFTTRALTLRVGPGAGTPEEEGWTPLAASLGVPQPALLRLRQVHGRTVVTVRAGEARPSVVEPPEADALVAADPACALAVRGADCVPVLLADRRTGAVGAAHAGWRGTAAGTAVAAVTAMTEAFGTRPEDVVAAFGPSIGPCCYEVGETLVAAFSAEGHEAAALGRWFSRPADSRLVLDLWAANRDQLAAAGVPAAHIHVSGVCTACHTAECFSYRREGEGIGRLAGVIRSRGAR